jgi:hypothetical protein
MAENVELRVMPSGHGSWYWEVITPGPTVIARGVADTEPRRVPTGQRSRSKSQTDRRAFLASSYEQSPRCKARTRRESSSYTPQRRQSTGARRSRDEWFKKCSRRDSDLSSTQCWGKCSSSYSVGAPMR